MATPNALAHYQGLAEQAKRLQQADYFKVAQPDEAIAPIYYELATEAVMADMDTFTDELGAACMHRTNVCSDRTTRRLAERGEQADEATLLHAALRAALRDDHETAGQCMKLLAERHLRYSATRINKLAAQYAAEAA